MKRTKSFLIWWALLIRATKRLMKKHNIPKKERIRILAVLKSDKKHTKRAYHSENDDGEQGLHMNAGNLAARIITDIQSLFSIYEDYPKEFTKLNGNVMKQETFREQLTAFLRELSAYIQANTEDPEKPIGEVNLDDI